MASTGRGVAEQALNGKKLSAEAQGPRTQLIPTLTQKFASFDSPLIAEKSPGRKPTITARP